MRMLEPIFEFKGYSIRNLIYSKEKIDSMELLDGTRNFELAVNQGFTANLDRAKLAMKVELVINSDTDESENPEGYLLLEIEGFFEIQNGLFIDDDGKQRDEVSLKKLFLSNATAILFPYVRSIVTQVTGLDSSNSVILPTLNLRNAVLE